MAMMHPMSPTMPTMIAVKRPPEMSDVCDDPQVTAPIHRLALVSSFSGAAVGAEGEIDLHHCPFLHVM